MLSDQGAAVLLLEKECGNETLFDQADSLLRDRGRREEMSRRLGPWACPTRERKSM